MKTIKSYLPIFPGFYGTHFSADCEEQVLEDEGVLYDEVDFDYEDYQDRISQSAISSIWNFLKHDGFAIDIEFEEVYSPREYNFGNDVINCTYKINSEDFQNLIDYLKANISEFKTFLKDNYSSYSGFISFFSTDVNIWFDEYLNEGSDKFEKAFTGILEFYLENESYTVDDMYDDCSSECSYIDYELKKEIA